MPSPSPSPVKRPQPLNARSASSGYSDLSPTTKPNPSKQAQQQQQQPQGPRAHYVTRHSRNFSHGKGLNKAGKTAAMANALNETRNHQRKRSGPVTPSVSPKPNLPSQLNRNNSHVVLPKNTSHGNLRKNQSAGTLAALNRNLSHGALRKLGAPPSQKAKEKDQNKQGVFDLGDQSSADEDEGEWEDSTTQSPELTRNNSKTATPVKSHSPAAASTNLPPKPHAIAEKTSSPPEPSLKNNNRSAPDFRHYETISQEQKNPPPDPALLYQNGRASRAPPAISAANATANPGHIKRNESMRSLQASKDGQFSQAETLVTPGIGQSSSGSVTVSHFLPTDSLPTSVKTRPDSSDEDADASTFMTNYRPQASQSPEKPRTLFNKPRVTSGPSRTQQKLELQRREAMRGNGAPPATTGAAGLGPGANSSLSLHSRAGSKGRARLSTGAAAGAGEVRIVKQDYETTIKLLTVVRRFRNPVLESLQRLKDNAILPGDIGTSNFAGVKQGSARPPSRHGRRMNGSTQTRSTTGTATATTTTTAPASLEDKKSSTSNQPSRSSSRVRGSRVQFQLSRHGSHDDMQVLTTSAGSPEGGVYDADADADGLSPEQALVRRMWESRIEVA